MVEVQSKPLMFRRELRGHPHFAGQWGHCQSVQGIRRHLQLKDRTVIKLRFIRNFASLQSSKATLASILPHQLSDNQQERRLTMRALSEAQASLERSLHLPRRHDEAAQSSASEMTMRTLQNQSLEVNHQ